MFERALSQLSTSLYGSRHRDVWKPTSKFRQRLRLGASAGHGVYRLSLCSLSFTYEPWYKNIAFDRNQELAVSILTTQLMADLILYECSISASRERP